MTVIKSASIRTNKSFTFLKRISMLQLYKRTIMDRNLDPNPKMQARTRI